MENFKKLVEKFWWMALVVLALIIKGGFKALMVAGLVGIVVWGIKMKRDKIIKEMFKDNPDGYVNYKGKIYAMDGEGEVYRVKAGNEI